MKELLQKIEEACAHYLVRELDDDGFTPTGAAVMRNKIRTLLSRVRVVG